MFGIMSPKTLYKNVAIGEVITWALLLTAMALKYSGTTEALMPIAGGIHGFVFLAFCVSTVLIWVNNQWSAGRGIAGLASALIPFMTIPFERNAEKHNLLERGWRFRAGSGDQPRTLPEKVLAFYVTKPAIAVLVTLIGLAIVFGGLLALGSPADLVRQ